MDHLHDKLRKYVSEDITPMHMPGHKRNPEMIDPCFSKDITEIRGFDNLHDPHGLISTLYQDIAAEIFRSTTYTCGGGIAYATDIEHKILGMPEIWP